MRSIPLSKTAAMGMAILGSAVSFALVTLLLLPGDLGEKSPLHLLPREETKLVIFPAGRDLLPLLRRAKIFLPYGGMPESLPRRLASGSTIGILALPCAASGTAVPPCGDAWIAVRPRIPLALEAGETAHGAFALRSAPEDISDRLSSLPSLAQHPLFTREQSDDPLFFLRKDALPADPTLTHALALRLLGTSDILATESGSGWTLMTGTPIVHMEKFAFSPLLPEATFWISIASPHTATDILIDLPANERAIAKGLLEHALQEVFGEDLSITEELLPLFTGDLDLALRSGTGALDLALRGETDAEMLPRVLPRIHKSAREMLTTTDVRRRQLDDRFTSVTIRMQPERITETEGTLPSGWRIRETIDRDSGRGIVTAVRGRTLALATSRALLEEALHASPNSMKADIVAEGVLSSGTLERLALESPLLDLFFAEALAMPESFYHILFHMRENGSMLSIRTALP